MTFADALELLRVFGGLAVTAVMSRWGYTAVTKVFRNELADGLRGKVDVSTYSAKVKELHDEINSLRVQVAVLKERAESK